MEGSIGKQLRSQVLELERPGFRCDLPHLLASVPWFVMLTAR